MNEKEFNSQICTTIEQSKRLLDLGLKPETADCFHWTCDGENYIGNITEELAAGDTPAWSLHRLIEIRFAADDIGLGVYNIHNRNFGSCYEILISVIEYLIKIGEFNKEYLQL
jgi:hypothetical protein